MFGAQIRAARLALGLTESSLARNAGVQRTQVRLAERDGNITTDTLRKILSQLPNISHLHVSEHDPGTVDASVVRDISSKVMAAAHYLYQYAGGPAGKPAGRASANAEIDEEEGTRILRLKDLIARGVPPIENEY
jgi:transcriptional regulator with XRE-family HTH domain